MSSGPARRPRSPPRPPWNASRPRSQPSMVQRLRNEQPAPPYAPLSRSHGHSIPSGSSPSPLVGKSKRVRTGCLTCRERHLKCDEGLPECNNCRKSNRECRRGIRLNFIDIQVNDPPCLPRATDWSFQILDESRSIASEYKGGLGRYPRTLPSPSKTSRDAPAVQKTGLPHCQAASNYLPGISSRADRPAIQGPYHAGHVGQLPPYGWADHHDHEPNRPSTGHAWSLLAARPAPAPQSSLSASARDGVPLASPQDVAAKEPGYHALNVTYRDESRAVSPRASECPMPQTTNLYASSSVVPSQHVSTPSEPVTPSSETITDERHYLNTDEEIELMQAFTDEVAVWMDALDKDKHFASTVPYLALKVPMLLNALLACGAKQLALTGSQNGEKADYYYGTATAQLLRRQQERDCDLSECAVTAVALSAYDIISDKPAQRMGHIATTRALIKECGWDASSGGLGAACFWVNVSMEVLSCLAFGWPTAWEPDQWGLDLEFATLGAASRSGSRSVAGSDDVWGARVDSRGGSQLDHRDGAEQGDEELWVHRIFYILAKIANFRANTPRFQEPSPHDEQVRLQSRFAEWRRLQNMCNAWNHTCPRSMRPYGYSPGPSEKSLFPNVWLLKPAAKLGRIFYHTSMCLLAQSNPLEPPRDRESLRGKGNGNSDGTRAAAQLHHAHHVCGIVAHQYHARDSHYHNARDGESGRDEDRDRGRGRGRGVAGVSVPAAVRCLATVAVEALVERAEQEEVLFVLGRVGRETGWPVEGVVEELRGAWGWDGTSTVAGAGVGAASGVGAGAGGEVANLAPFSVRDSAAAGLKSNGREGVGRVRGVDDWG